VITVVENNISMTRTTAVPGVLDDPMRNRGVAFTLAERRSPWRNGRPSAGGVATSQPDTPVQAVQDAMWQPAYPDAVS
jgi:hypothetical protein